MNPISQHYQSKLVTAEKAIGKIPSGKRVFIGSSCGEPQHLVNTLMDQAPRFSDLELFRLLSLGESLFSMMCNEACGNNFSIRSIYQGSGMVKGLSTNRRFLTSMNLYAVPEFFKKRLLPIHYALIQVSPPDDYGWMSLGISVDITLAAAQTADYVIAQVNPKMPRILGNSFIHVNDVQAIVEKEEDLLTVYDIPEIPSIEIIAKLLHPLIEDGSTVHMGLGFTSKAIALILGQKNDLGIHTQSLVDAVMDLAESGVVTNKHKGLNENKIVASCAIGTPQLYKKLHNNPSVEFRPADYVNYPKTILQHHKMVSIHLALEMDLKGHVAADALPQNLFMGVTGMIDFVRGSTLAPGGKSIIVIPSTRENGQVSNIVPMLETGDVVVPASDISYVVSEYGAVSLFGKNNQERAMAMISLAHPSFRDYLFTQAKELGLIGQERTLKESIYGIYPAWMEDTRKMGETLVTFRPAKITDERAIQEHFYGMNQQDIATRFFGIRANFPRESMEDMFQVDYIKNLSIVATTGEMGLEKIIGIGVYMVEPGQSLAEIAFSTAEQWKGKGLATILIHKIAEAARGNGITGLTAFTLPSNVSMIKLFKKLPYPVKSIYEDGMVTQTCRFDEAT